MQNYFGTFYFGEIKPQNSNTSNFKSMVNIKHIATLSQQKQLVLLLAPM